MILPQDEDKPKNFKEAIPCPDKEKWIKEMEKRNGIYENQPSLGIGRSPKRT